MNNMNFLKIDKTIMIILKSTYKALNSINKKNNTRCHMMQVSRKEKKKLKVKTRITDGTHCNILSCCSGDFSCTTTAIYDSDYNYRECRVALDVLARKLKRKEYADNKSPVKGYWLLH